MFVLNFSPSFHPVEFRGTTNSLPHLLVAQGCLSCLAKNYDRTLFPLRRLKTEVTIVIVIACFFSFLSGLFVRCRRRSSVSVVVETVARRCYLFWSSDLCSSHLPKPFIIIYSSSLPPSLSSPLLPFCFLFNSTPYCHQLCHRRNHSNLPRSLAPARSRASSCAAL